MHPNALLVWPPLYPYCTDRNISNCSLVKVRRILLVLLLICTNDILHSSWFPHLLKIGNHFHANWNRLAWWRFLPKLLGGSHLTSLKPYFHKKMHRQLNRPFGSRLAPESDTINHLPSSHLPHNLCHIGVKHIHQHQNHGCCFFRDRPKWHNRCPYRDLQWKKKIIRNHISLFKSGSC